MAEVRTMQEQLSRATQEAKAEGCQGRRFLPLVFLTGMSYMLALQEQKPVTLD